MDREMSHLGRNLVGKSLNIHCFTPIQKDNETIIGKPGCNIPGPA